MPTYEILLDRDAIVNPDDDDATFLAAFVELASDASATFTNPRLVPNADTHAFSPADAIVYFDATPDDAARYARAYDADDAITLVTA